MQVSRGQKKYMYIYMHIYTSVYEYMNTVKKV